MIKKSDGWRISIVEGEFLIQCKLYFGIPTILLLTFRQFPANGIMNTKQPDSALRRRFAPHSPGPDPISDNLVTEFINETETRGRGLPNSILRINEPHRVAQPGEG